MPDHLCSNSERLILQLHSLKKMSSFLKRKLTVLQVLALVAISVVLVLMSSIYYFTPSGTLALPAIAKHDKDSATIVASIPDTGSLARLKAAVDLLGNSPELAHGGFGFFLADADSGKVLCDFNSRRTLVPASILKTVTTGTALSILGPGYHYSTLLQHDGKTEGKVLKGNVYIHGSGDPRCSAARVPRTS